jgi:LytS/YehU family sensor histidine kinase
VRSHAWSLFVDVLQRSSLLVYVYVTQRMTAHARKRQQAAELARASARRRALESQLQAMQARVEPKFLLNTLAEVGRLYETDAVLGDAMLDDLITCLRAALPHLRESTSTLGKEAQLAGAYLNILRVSSEGRMAFAFDVPETVRGAHLPALVLLPLISQVLAARHGSANAGGRMDVVAHVAYGRLFLSIAGSGTDFVESKVDQELTDIQLRIRALYGGTASLRIEQVHPHGLVANLVIPCEGVAEGVSDAPLDARAAIS